MSEVLEKLDTMDGKLDELLIWKAGHDEKHESIARDITEVREVLFDNPGLKTKVEGLMHNKNNIGRTRDFWMYVLKVIIAAAIIAIIAWLLKFYKND